jgi:hypothetical protein
MATATQKKKVHKVMHEHRWRCEARTAAITPDNLACAASPVPFAEAQERRAIRITTPPSSPIPTDIVSRLITGPAKGEDNEISI